MTTEQVSTSLSPATMGSAETPNDRFASRLRGFGFIGILAVLAVLAGNFIVAPLSAVLVLLWARLSNTSWRDLGFVRPKSWSRTLILGTFLGVALKFLMKALVMPLLGAPPINQAYHFLASNTAALPGMVLTMIVVAGFGEETVFRGYLFERLTKLLGPGVSVRLTIILLTSAWFAGLHYPEQGVPGVEQAAITGLVFGAMFAITRQLWLPMVVHAAFDLAAVAMIYWNVEFQIAHLFFT